MEINDLLTTIVNQNVRFALRQGTVVSLQSGSLTITLSGGSNSISGVKYLASYSPTIGDVIFVMVNNKDLIILGKLAV